MSLNPLPPFIEDELHPDSDGKPMADSTLQFDWIDTLVGGLKRLFADHDDVFVAGDLLWYPDQASGISAAPDAMVVFGRPKGHRRSYKQWQEDDMGPQVTFEVRSYTNTNAEMEKKLEFYQNHGVEEYFLYDPDRGTLEGWTRLGEKLRPVQNMQGWKSPLLQITFALEGKDLCLTDANDRRFVSYIELVEQQVEAEKRAENEFKMRQAAEQRADTAEAELQRLRALLQEKGIE